VPNVATLYPTDSKPEDVFAADTYAAILKWLYLDVAVHGYYNATAWAYIEERGYEPVIMDGDMDILRQAKPDFIAFNYYTSQTVGESSGGKADYSHTGDQHETVGEPGAYRGSVNDNHRKTEFSGEIDPDALRLK